MIELQLIEESQIVKNYSILDFKQGENYYYLKAQISFQDNSCLMIRVFMSEDDYNYSFHWQDINEELIIRWDNSPHHKDISTYPHHKHVEGMTKPSKEISLKEVMKFIEKQMIT